MAVLIKHPTKWRPPSGQGSTSLIGNIKLVDTTNHLPLVDTANHLPIVTNPTLTIPKNPTSWTEVG